MMIPGEPLVIAYDPLALAMERAARGAALLDRECPGWASRIDAGKLYMGSCEWCILGQLFGDYVESPVACWEDPVRFGFESETGHYRALRDAWVAEINERLARGDQS